MITSLQNPLIKQIRKLHRPKERREQNLFLLEGTHLIETACIVNCSLDTLCFTPQWQQQYPQLWENVTKRTKRLEMVTSEVMDSLATTVHPDGVVATVQRTSIALSFPSQLQLGLVLERIQDPGNLGTIIRTAVATKVEGLWLSTDSVDLDSPKVIRSSAGEWFRLPMRVAEDIQTVVKDYQSQGVQVIATLPQARKTYWEVDFTQPTLILLGNEGAGLSEALAACADTLVKIPLAGGVESLNVAIAAALILYEARRQLHQLSVISNHSFSPNPS